MSALCPRIVFVILAVSWLIQSEIYCNKIARNFADLYFQNFNSFSKMENEFNSGHEIYMSFFLIWYDN